MKIANRYLVGPKIGGGSFGDIYIVTVQGSNTVMALKKED